ncbi:MAG: SDR family oxidoreductase [Calditrichaeota bacterium]|nr:SDR family oxidoreductase [Calditrichota bacterium]MCB9391567.1 SDR family oxidoreductase [Calditrichota bacterium]
MPSRYLITGGAGFIGSNIVEELLRRGQSVRVFDNFSTGKRENLAAFLNDIELHEGDLRDESALARAVKGCDYVLHQGALGSVPRSIHDPVTTHEVNIRGTLNALIAARDAGVKRFVAASSSSVYGNTPTLPKIESMPVLPLSPYAVSKLATEKYCAAFHSVYGLETVALRYFNIFGPRQDPASQYAAVIPLFITRAMKNESPIVHGDGKQSRDFTFVDNAVSANLLACEAPADKVAGEFFNVACGERYSLLDILNGIGAALGKDISPVHEPTRAGDVRDSLASIEKFQTASGYRVLVTMPEGLKRTVDYFKKA